jgi:hypothetical protein
MVCYGTAEAVPLSKTGIGFILLVLYFLRKAWGTPEGAPYRSKHGQS